MITSMRCDGTLVWRHRRPRRGLPGSRCRAAATTRYRAAGQGLAVLRRRRHHSGRLPTRTTSAVGAPPRSPDDSGPRASAPRGRWWKSTSTVTTVAAVIGPPTSSGLSKKRLRDRSTAPDMAAIQAKKRQRRHCSRPVGNSSKRKGARVSDTAPPAGGRSSGEPPAIPAPPQARRRRKTPRAAEGRGRTRARAIRRGCGDGVRR
jgi:hypothetical protein